MTGNYTGFPATFPDPPTYLSYPFIDGKITFNDPSDGAPFDVLDPNYFLAPSERFTIGGGSRVEDCALDGYRKVFIDLRPNGAGTYTITMDMLITTASGQQVVNIFNNVPYNFSAPQNLKVGFAAATGDRTSFHEIRNVTVEVSSIDAILAPDPDPLNEIVCFDEDLTFNFEVDLNATNQFIRCLQLYETNPGPPNNNPNPNGDPFVGNCGLSGVCEEKCKPENKIITIPGVGTFESILEELTDSNFGDERNKASIKFTPEPGFFGTHTIYYTVIDNYGLTSFPETVTVTVNPFPKIDGSGAVIGPTCNGQNDGSINNVILKDLIPGYVFNWKDQFGNVLPASNYTVTETAVGGYIEATVGVTGVNLGEYFLTVSNPATNNICEDVFPFDVTDERGTPVIVDVDDQQICAGTPVVFEPRIDPAYGVNPTFLWYKDNGKTQPITNGLTEGSIEYSIVTPGILTITGLPENASVYEFFVEVAADPAQNLCATPAGSLKVVQALVLPPLNINATVTDDLCREASGQILVNPTGGFGTYTYSIDGVNYQNSNTFSGLLPGTYTIDVNAGTNCIGSITREVLGPDEPLSITYSNQVNPSCGLENGEITFEVSGGTPGSGYTFTLDGNPVSPTLSSGIYTITGIGELPTIIVEVIDSNGCNATITTPAFNATPIPSFDATDAVICPGETAILTAQTIELSNATNLQYTWLDGTGNTISNGTSNGITYAVNSTTGELTIDGLAENVTPYNYSLVVSGDNLCNSNSIPATVTVNPVPKIIDATPTDVTCFGGNDGTITLNPLDPALATSYEYSLDGGSTFQSSNTFNGLIAGTYDFVIRNSGTNCATTLDGIVVNEPSEIILGLDQVIQPACGEENGLLEISFSGGTPDYTVALFRNGAQVESVSAATSPIIYQDLAPGIYEVRITDGNNCIQSLSQELIDDVGIAISADPMIDEICEGDIATFTPVITTTGNPSLQWFKDAGANDPITSSATPGSDGITYLIDPTTLEITIDGLQPGDYSYYLVATGAGYCPSPPFEATVKVFEKLDASTQVTNEICFQAADGTITVNATGADGNYEFSFEGGPFETNNVFTGLAPGDYTIDIRSGNGCVFQVIETIEGPSQPITATADRLRSSCSEANGSIDNLQVSGGWGNYTIEWRKGSDTGQIVSGDLSGAPNLLPDTYFAIITDEEGCQFIESFLIEEQPLPGYDITQTTVCEGEDVILTPVNTVSGSSPSDIFWFKDQALTQPIQEGTDPVDPNISYSISTSGELTIQGLPGSTSPYTYYLNVVCGNQIVEAIAQVNPLPTPEMEAQDVLCFGEANGIIRLTSASTSEYEDTNYLFTISQTGESNTIGEFSNLVAGTYDVIVVNTNTNCTTTLEPIVINEPTELIAGNEDSESPICQPDNGSIYWEVSGGTLPYSYSLTLDSSPVTGFSVQPQGIGFEITGLIGGDYELVITDANGCQIPLNYSLIPQVDPEFEVSNTSICETEDATLIPQIVELGVPVSTPIFKWFRDPQGNQEILNGSADPNLSGVFYEISGNSELTVSGLPPSASPYVYYLEVTGNNTCNQDLIPAEILVNPLPTPDFETEPEQCFGAADGKIKVSANGLSTYTYTIAGRGTLDAGGLENEDFAPGFYTIEVENSATACLNTFEVEVLGPGQALNVAPLTQIDPGCGADIGIIKTQITGGWAPYTVSTFKDGSLLSSDVVNGPVFQLDDLAPGDYYLEISDAEGCLVTSNTVTLVYGPSQVLVDDIEICEGEVAVFKPNVNPAAAGATFEWYKDQGLTQPIVSNSTPDANGHTFDIAADGTLSVSGLDNSDSPVRYYVIAVGNGVCPGFVASPTVQIFDEPSASFNVIDEVCFGEKGSIVMTGSGGSGIYEYSINGIDFQSSNILEVAPGIYDVTVRSGGCQSVVMGIEVEGPSAPISTTEPSISNPTCNQTNGLISFEISGGYGDYVVAVNRNGQNYANLTISDGLLEIQDLPSGTYDFAITDNGGCLFEVSTPVTLVDGLTPVEAQDEEICEGEVATLIPTTSQQGITPVFTWYQNSNGTGEITNGSSNGISYQIAQDGTLSISGLTGKSTPYVYYLEISGPGTCPPPLLPVEVVVYSIPNLRVSNPSIVCDPEGTVDLTQFIEGFNSSVYDYQIESPSGSIMRLDEIDEVDQSGEYIVQSSVKGSNCWSPTQRIQVLIADEELIPKFNYEIDLGGGNILTNGEVQIQEPVAFMDSTLGDVIIWNWDFGDGFTSSEQNPSHEFQSKGVYTVTLSTIDAFGCTAEFQRVIEVFDDYMIMVPNAFTPDGLKNQYFRPESRGVASMEFYIFNTWGELIYQSKTLDDIGWDGTLNGTAVPNGNYVYRAVFETRSGETVEKSGVFVLIR
ncbi:PKD domain-containing protein [Algoriphagus sp.]|uniref:PKD domain-containing protein n=1 Tax=Algoriphagus sp. TaxID=1872435 RepID=UPI0025F28671|nr:PKD domain-containing protein [Algoriphagus sp.]